MKQLRSVDQKRLHRAWQRRTDQRVALLLDGVQDPFNVGSIVRTAAALRVEHLYLTAHATAPEHPKVGKTALGTERYLEWTQYERGSPRPRGRRTPTASASSALELADESVPFFELDLAGDVCMALGNESNGLNDAALACCDAVGYLPLLGRVGSLNVAAAAAVALVRGAPTGLAVALIPRLVTLRDRARSPPRARMASKGSAKCQRWPSRSVAS